MSIEIDGSYAVAGMYNVVARKDLRDAWINSHDLHLGKIDCMGAIIDRVLVPARISGVDVMMDAITGTVYCIKTGLCYSSDFLRMTKIRLNNKKCAELLRGVKSGWIDER